MKFFDDLVNDEPPSGGGESAKRAEDFLRDSKFVETKVSEQELDLYEEVRKQQAKNGITEAENSDKKNVNSEENSVLDKKFGFDQEEFPEAETRFEQSEKGENEKTVSMTLPETKEQVRQVYNSLELFSITEAYAVRLRKAQSLKGEMRLQVLRNVLGRLVAFAHRVSDDIESKMEVLNQSYAYYRHSDEKDSVMAQYIAIYIAKLDKIRHTWDETISEQHEENLLKLEEILNQENE